jgi:hypothetical protein
LANGGTTPHFVAYRFMNVERIINGRAAEKRADAPYPCPTKGRGNEGTGCGWLQVQGVF